MGSSYHRKEQMIPLPEINGADKSLPQELDCECKGFLCFCGKSESRDDVREHNKICKDLSMVNVGLNLYAVMIAIHETKLFDFSDPRVEKIMRMILKHEATILTMATDTELYK